mmetsp:Transcript_31799/g.46856  ORF Transcript_31799/g.46856 Transcript_31799/m.46856 type:complete len:218 (-) Transcript_31799:2663-3316(-)
MEVGVTSAVETRFECTERGPLVSEATRNTPMELTPPFPAATTTLRTALPTQSAAELITAFTIRTRRSQADTTTTHLVTPALLLAVCTTLRTTPVGLVSAVATAAEARPLPVGLLAATITGRLVTTRPSVEALTAASIRRWATSEVAALAECTEVGAILQAAGMTTLTAATRRLGAATPTATMAQLEPSRVATPTRSTLHMALCPAVTVTLHMATAPL